MATENKCFSLLGYKLNLNQLHETAHQLYNTIDEFKVSMSTYFTSSDEYKAHIIGKLKFFVDLYCEINSHLHINETVVTDNYQTMLRVLAKGYNDDDLSDVFNDYTDFILATINDILDFIDANNMTDIDDILNFIGSHKHLNFQEKQLIVDIYYSTLDNWQLQAPGIMDTIVDYHDVTWNYAINDFCKTYDCDPTDVHCMRMYNIDDEHEYDSREFYVYLLHHHDIDLDLTIDFEGCKTIKDWLQYILDTMVDHNDTLKLITADDDQEGLDVIGQNNRDILKLQELITMAESGNL